MLSMTAMSPWPVPMSTPATTSMPGHDPEMFRRKFWLSLALTLPSC